MQRHGPAPCRTTRTTSTSAGHAGPGGGGWRKRVQTGANGHYSAAGRVRRVAGVSGIDGVTGWVLIGGGAVWPVGRGAPAGPQQPGASNGKSGVTGVTHLDGWLNACIHPVRTSGVPLSTGDPLMHRRHLPARAALAVLALAISADAVFAQTGEIRIAHVYSKTGPLQADGIH